MDGEDKNYCPPTLTKRKRRRQSKLLKERRAFPPSIAHLRLLRFLSEMLDSPALKFCGVPLRFTLKISRSRYITAIISNRENGYLVEWGWGVFVNFTYFLAIIRRSDQTCLYSANLFSPTAVGT